MHQVTFDADTVEGTVHLGWTCRIEMVSDGDGFDAPDYWAVPEEGREKLLNWSRFRRFRPAHFRAFVEAGFPPCPNGSWWPSEIEGLPEYGQFTNLDGGAVGIVAG